MLQNRPQKPISPQQMFQLLLGQSYRQAQCQDQSQKLKKQKIVLIELIQEYDRSIEAQLIKINQCDNLERLRMQKIQELQRLKRQRDVIEQSVNEEMARIAITEGQREQKVGLVTELQEVRCVNIKLRTKCRDLLQYVQRLQLHNRTLQKQKDMVQTKIVNRLRVNSQDWRQNIDLARKRQQHHQHQYRTKILQKQTQQIKNVRKQEEQILQRNEARWQEFRKTAFKPSLISYKSGVQQDLKSFVSRRLPERNFQRFRVI